MDRVEEVRRIDEVEKLGKTFGYHKVYLQRGAREREEHIWVASTSTQVEKALHGSNGKKVVVAIANDPRHGNWNGRVHGDLITVLTMGTSSAVAFLSDNSDADIKHV